MSTKYTNPDPLLTMEEAAAWSGFHANTIRRRINEGILPASKFGTRAIRVRLSDLETWMRAGDPQ